MKIHPLIYLLLVSITIFPFQASAQDNQILNGKVTALSDGKPLEYVLIKISDANLWTTSDGDGNFSLEIEKFPVSLDFRYLGKQFLQLEVKNSDFLHVRMKDNNLGLEEVVVTAKQNKEEITSSYTINSTAIEHAQLSNINGITSLLPGGHTQSDNLSNSSSSRITLRGEQGEIDDPDYGTAIEVDGIRMSSNASFGDLAGVDPRIISPENIEKVEVITGIPSVEHGDLTSGMVKVISKQGVMPFTAKVASNPRQKQVSLSKGMKLGKNAGVLNFSYDYTKATTNIASPYTSYTRNAFTLKHKKVFFSDINKPLSLSSTIGGNIGGYNSKSDPDEFSDSYTKESAFNLRGGVNIDWDLNSKIISKLNFSANINYSDNKRESYAKYSSASGNLAFHGTEEGYYVAELYEEGEPLDPIQFLPPGHWYQTTYTDSKPLNYGLKLKLQKNIHKKNTTSEFKLGADFTASGNEGKGVYYGNEAYIPDWREHQYSDEPYLNNLAIYAEESIKYRFNQEHSLQITGGVRNNYTFVKDSRYGNVKAFSPRFKFKHTIIKNSRNKFLKELSWYAGWGRSVKLPSFGTLYTVPSYYKHVAFVPGSLADGTTYYAYYIEPNEVLKNESLKWYKNRKIEVGVKGKIKGMKFSLSYYNSLGKDSYTSTKNYIPFTYYLTTPHQLTNVAIPYENRSYTIDEEGTVSVHDKNGTLPSEILDKQAREVFKSATYADNNSSPVKRQGLEWVFDFGKIKPLYTSLRIDGKYYYYKYISHKIQSSWQTDNQLMSDGRPYRYIGYYYGGSTSANGVKTQRLTSNATLITHIPKLRLVFTLRLEGTFINSKQSLSEMPGGERSFTIDRVGQTIPSSTNGDIYSGGYTATYPLYYTSFDDMETQIPFREKYLWAHENDQTLYNDLSKMVINTNRDYTFKKQSYTPYFSANINVSKEIGKLFKMTFYANNFLNSMAKVKQKQDDTEKSLLNGGGLITPFYYGISLKIKL